jgi:hypothetical protein
MGLLLLLLAIGEEVVLHSASEVDQTLLVFGVVHLLLLLLHHHGGALRNRLSVRTEAPIVLGLHVVLLQGQVVVRCSVECGLAIHLIHI